MKILVLNGSPKGDYSVTLHTVKYLEILHPEHEFEVLQAGQQIKKLERDFSPAVKKLQEADILLFSYPVYTFLVPSQLHRFIELMKESKIDFTEKFASQITTSKHFYDMTAHSFIQDNCMDMGIRVIRGLSADMDDLLSEKGQREARQFFDFMVESVQKNWYEPFAAAIPPAAHCPVTLPAPASEEKNGDVVIVTDCREEDRQLSAMIERFRRVCSKRTRVVNIREFPFNGGCLGCFRCAITGKCIYPDHFDSFLREKIQSAEAIVYAFSIRDHSMGYRFKMYDDRQFCNGHRSVTMGKPVGYLISGSYEQEINLRTVVESRAQVGQNFLAGTATDEREPDREIDQLAAELDYALRQNYQTPQNFYGIGGMKIFRDLIWLMQGLMRADHKFYKEHGQYDFPQKHRGRMLQMYLVGSLMANKKLQKKMGNRMNEGIIMPYRKVLEKLK